MTSVKLIQEPENHTPESEETHDSANILGTMTGK